MFSHPETIFDPAWKSSVPPMHINNIPGIGHIWWSKSSIYSVESQLDHVDRM